ncbi:MAG: leucyl/phenylalanyl-tRNA--protein transferase [Pseudomonadales bacterium]
MRSQRTLPWLDPEPVRFPDPRTAWSAPDGLLAAGGALSVEWLLTAYGQGIFPWFDDDNGPILWWSPDPRAGLEPGSMHVSRSLRRAVRSWLREGTAWASVDQNFPQVMVRCAGPRRQSSGTWITAKMRRAYTDLHRAGHAHSVEIWRNEELVGGIYGVAVGQVFCGESMFSGCSNGSKVAFFILNELLRRRGFKLLDAQMPTEHLYSLGVRAMSRDRYLALIRQFGQAATQPGAWSLDSDLASLSALSGGTSTNLASTL